MADETKANATAEVLGGPPASEQTEQVVIPSMDGGSAPINVPPEQGAAGSVTEYTKQEWERPLAEIEAEQKSPSVAAHPRQRKPRRRPEKRKRAGATLLRQKPRTRLSRLTRGPRPPAKASGPPPPAGQ